MRAQARIGAAAQQHALHRAPQRCRMQELHRQPEQAAAQQREPGRGGSREAAAQDEAAQARRRRGSDRDGERAREGFAEQHEGLVGRQLRADAGLEFVVALRPGTWVAHDVDARARVEGFLQRFEEIARAIHAGQQNEADRRRHFQAARNASMTFAELSAAMFMKVPISFSPSPPPARSLSERKAM